MAQNANGNANGHSARINYSVLVVDDEPDMRTALQDLLEDDFTVLSAENGRRALEVMGSQEVSVLLADQRMPGLQGDELLAQAQQVSLATRILITGYADYSALTRAVNNGQIYAYVPKPWNPADLKQVLCRATQHYELNCKLAQTRQLLGQVKEQADQLLGLNHNLEVQLDTVARLNHELKLTNQELETFSYTVSHDLRNPLSTVLGFSELLLSECLGGMSDTGQRYLDHIRTGATRMERLITTLLNFSRSGRGPLQLATVNLSEIAHDVVSQLQTGQRSVEWVVQPDLVARADAPLLEVLLLNLLNNAYKFTSQRDCARIEFGARRQDDETVYYVQDNGAGFDPEHAHKLFQPFQRLHAGEFPGTGIGLATVARIVGRHGGRAWAEGHPDRGATFHFTLGSMLLS